MGFDDLEAAERDRQDEGDGSTQAESGDPEQRGEPDQPNSAATSSTEREDSSRETGGGEASDQSSETVSDGPAFEYGEVKQSPLYARPEAWNALEDALDLRVVRALREAGVRNEEKRELHDAVLRVAAEHPEEIAEAVEAARRGDD